MRCTSRVVQSFLLIFALVSFAPARAQNEEAPKKGKTSKTEKAAAAADLPAVLWRDPGDIPSLDLIHGIGGAQDAPGEHEEYKFVKEDLNGTSAKFYVEDKEGVQWLLKIGEEAQPETAATRLVWSMGYFTDEDYYLPAIRVSGIPHLHRGNNSIAPDGTVSGVRLKRQNKTEKNIGNWSWFDNPFLHTREFDGLRVMMALINDWDLKTDNNKIYSEKDTERRYVVSDEGASFGRTGAVTTRSKGNLQEYREAKFIDHIGADEVDFVMATRPLPLLAPFELPNFKRRYSMENVVKHIPRANAKWIGQQLARLTAQQIGDAFRAAGYSEDGVRGYTQAVMARITQLNAL
jgi:hypothetical protein